MRAQTLLLLLLGFGSLGLAGCARQSGNSNQPLLPQRVYVDPSAIASHNSTEGLPRALAAYQEQAATIAKRVPELRSPADTPSPVENLQLSISLLHSRQRARLVRQAFAEEERRLNAMRQQAQATLDSRVEAKRLELEEVNKDRLAALEQSVNEKLAAEIAQLPTRYAYRAASIDLKLKLPRSGSGKRAELEAQRDALQTAWRRELADLWDAAQRELQQERQKLERSTAEELESEQKKTASRFLKPLRQQRARLSDDLLRSGDSWKAISIATAVESSPYRAVALRRSPSHSAMIESRKKRMIQLRENLQKESRLVSESLMKAARKQGIAILHEHRWAPQPAPETGVPDKTSQVIKELRSQSWPSGTPPQ